MQHALELDAKGLTIPIYMSRLRKMLKRMYPGQLLKVIATDPNSIDMLSFYCLYSGNQLLESKSGQNEKRYVHTIKKQPHKY